MLLGFKDEQAYGSYQGEEYKFIKENGKVIGDSKYKMFKGIVLATLPDSIFDISDIEKKFDDYKNKKCEKCNYYKEEDCLHPKNIVCKNGLEPLMTATMQRNQPYGDYCCDGNWFKSGNIKVPDTDNSIKTTKNIFNKENKKMICPYCKTKMKLVSIVDHGYIKKVYWQCKCEFKDFE